MNRLRIAVVGGGLIAQAIHLPNLKRLEHLFELVAIADASAAVAEGLAVRFHCASWYVEWEELLDSEQIDAVLICSPNATHAAITLAALGRGLHVLVEKPLCISPADADKIVELSASSGRVVMVGYMKRYHPAYQALLDGLPDSADGLRLIDVVTYDPWMAREPYVPWNQMIHGGIPAAALEALQESEREQVEAAIGSGDPQTVRAFSHTYLACLIHDLNLIHGALDRLGLTETLAPLSGSDWAEGDAASILLATPSGARCHSAWVLLPEQPEFRERLALYFSDSVHELTFATPYLVDVPATRTVTCRRGSQHTDEKFAFDPYQVELEHFHHCIIHGNQCKTPPEQAARDIGLLCATFRAGLSRPLSDGAATV